MPEIMLTTKHSKTCQVKAGVVSRRQPRCHFGILPSIAMVQKRLLVPRGLHSNLLLFHLSPDFNSYPLIIILLVEGLMCPLKAAQGTGNPLRVDYRCNSVSL